ncbi:alkaline phosphatase family protein [Paenibacillus guangzhouensis]|uniref:alkaline phosphatase family protein n=1 Tax=Paenibacillus guangzhouensis TaxID=1473112 RepID=UPI0012669886|nr:alkaline phosphatase family protein [Paenibacillus guangzhouensis]
MRKRLTSCLTIMLLLLMMWGCRPLHEQPKSTEQDLVHLHTAQQHTSKKVIFILVDSLMAQAIDQGIQRQELPTLQYLIEQGQYYKNMVSSYPTMSVSIDSSLLTGSYPNGHHVPGLTWFSTDSKKLINYGTGPMEIMKQGMEKVILDGLVHLNGSHLNPRLPTLYEELASRGLRSASINGMIYRGRSMHKLTIPSWAQDLTSLPGEISVFGPEYLALGALSDPLQDKAKLSKSLLHRLGMNNAYAIESLNYLIRTKALPDFSFVYLPDIDHELHQKGPANMKDVKEIKAVDQQLHSMLQAFGSPKEMLDQAVIIIAGDSGMTQILPASEHPVIELPDLLRHHRVLQPGKSVMDDTEIVLAVNETMAYVYNLKQRYSLRNLADEIALDPRIDYVAWREPQGMIVKQGGTVKELRYTADGHLMDPYQQPWTVEGDLDVLDLRVDQEHHTLNYGQYPDALMRLSGALHSHPGEFLVVGAKPGYELADRSSPTHKGGGGHGSLRHEESLVPLIICGTDKKPEHLRIIDLKPFMLQLLSTQEMK